MITFVSFDLLALKELFMELSNIEDIWDVSKKDC